jgi:hypothetical protein
MIFNGHYYKLSIDLKQKKNNNKKLINTYPLHINNYINVMYEGKK